MAQALLLYRLMTLPELAPARPVLTVRSPRGEKLVFSDLEEFCRAVSAGIVRDEWQVYHATGERWVPVTAHPTYRAAAAALPPETTPRHRTPDLVLIYPDGSTRIRQSGPHEASDAATEAVVSLTDAELERVRTISGERPAITPDPTPGPPPARHSARLVNPWLSGALRTVPTFSRAVVGVAALIQSRQ